MNGALFVLVGVQLPSATEPVEGMFFTNTTIVGFTFAVIVVAWLRFHCGAFYFPARHDRYYSCPRPFRRAEAAAHNLPWPW